MDVISFLHGCSVRKHSRPWMSLGFGMDALFPNTEVL